jgi:hypothetical protein
MSNLEQGLRKNWKQFTLLVIINGFVGGMVGLERREAIRLLWEQMKEGNMRAFTIYFDRRYGRAMPKSLPKTDALQRFEVEVIGGQGDNVFKRIVESIRFENDAGET